MVVIGASGLRNRAEPGPPGARRSADEPGVSQMAGRWTSSEERRRRIPRYGDKTLSKFINCVMTARRPPVRVIYDAMDIIEDVKKETAEGRSQGRSASSTSPSTTPSRTSRCVPAHRRCELPGSPARQGPGAAVPCVPLILEAGGGEGRPFALHRRRAYQCQGRGARRRPPASRCNKDGRGEQGLRPLRQLPTPAGSRKPDEHSAKPRDSCIPGFVVYRARDSLPAALDAPPRLYRRTRCTVRESARISGPARMDPAHRRRGSTASCGPTRALALPPLAPRAPVWIRGLAGVLQMPATRAGVPVYVAHVGDVQPPGAWWMSKALGWGSIRRVVVVQQL